MVSQNLGGSCLILFFKILKIEKKIAKSEKKIIKENDKIDKAEKKIWNFDRKRDLLSGMYIFSNI